jgi:hypothetical protein
MFEHLNHAANATSSSRPCRERHHLRRSLPLGSDARTAHPNAGAPEVIEQRVRATFDAIARADTATLSGLLSDSLRWFSPTSGAVYNKPQLLGAPTA